MQPLLGAARDNETAKGVIELTGWLTGEYRWWWEEDNFNAKRLAVWLILSLSGGINSYQHRLLRLAVG